MNFLIYILRFLPAALGAISRLSIYIFFGTASSLTWLWYYLKKDILPESKKMVLKIFIYGILIALPVFVIETGLSILLTKLKLPSIFVSFLYWFVAIALVEEILKYLVVKEKVFKHYEFDEPTDVMIYMIVAAMGFSALENVLYLLPPVGKIFPFVEIFKRTIIISFFRFIGATILHALCSGLVGYFVALACLETKKKLRLTFLGLFLATVLHGFYNFSIMEGAKSIKIIIPVVILLGLALFVSFAFKKLKKIKSVCKIV